VPALHAGFTLHLAISPDGGRLLTGTNEKVAQIWSAETGARLEHLETSSAVVQAEFSPRGDSVVVCAHGASPILWFPGRTGADKPLPHGNVVNAAFSPDGAGLATIANDSGVQLWDTRGLRALGTLVAPGALTGFEIGTERSLMSYSPDGRRLVT